MNSEKMDKQPVLETCLWFMLDWLENRSKAIPGDRDTREGRPQDGGRWSESKGGGDRVAGRVQQL